MDEISEYDFVDVISLGVLSSSVPRDVVDECIEVTGRQAKRSGGTLPPHVMVLFTMGLALFAEADYEEVAARLAGTLRWWGCWDEAWDPSSAGLTQARKRLGHQPLKMLFEQVAIPVAEPLTRGAFLAGYRLMAIDGFEWDAPDSDANAEAFGYTAGSEGRSAFPKVRVVTVSECGSHAMIDAEIGEVGEGKARSEHALARLLYPRLEPDWLLIADRNFYNFADWQAAQVNQTQLLWRVKSTQRLPVLRRLQDGSYLSLQVKRGIRPDRGVRYQRIWDDVQAGRKPDPAEAALVRVIEYTVPDRDGNGKNELFRLVTTITDPATAPAAALAQAYHERWEHENANDQIKTHLRGPGKVLRSKSPDMIRAEIYGYLLTHYALSALICQAATEADIDPDRVKFKRTVRIVRRSIDATAAFSP